MRAGLPLRDEDRWPWLDRIGACLADRAQWPDGVAIACSALKRAYRDRIRAAAPGVRFVFLDGPAELIGARMARRVGHYMPATLLESQLQTLEPPCADEPDALRVSIELPADAVIAAALRSLKSESPRA
jgi:carbohydrate kinase (thermoresistant glucokinase family)